MRDFVTDKKKRNLIILSSLAFLVICHSYRWMNTMYSHDSILILQWDRDWQISLGRIFNPVYVWLRGFILAPMNIGVLAGIFIIISAAFVIYILKLKRNTSIVLCCGLLATFETIAFVNAVFLLSLDLDMLALLFSVLAAYFLTGKQSPIRYAAGVICITIQLGLFQSYIEVTILLICLEILREVLEGGDPKKLFLKGLRCIGFLILGGLLYYICLKVVMGCTGIVSTTKANGLAKMNDLTIPYAFSLAKDAYKFTLRYLFVDSMIYHRVISRWIYRALWIFSLSGITYIAIKKRLGKEQIALIVFLLLIMPLGGNCVYILSLGFKHSLMNYAFVFFSIMAVMVFDMLASDLGNKAAPLPAAAQAGTDDRTILQESEGAAAKGKRRDLAYYLPYAIPVLCAVLIFNHILFANQWYTRTDLNAQAGTAFMTRVITDIEDVEGYEAGKTPVMILGHIDDCPAAYHEEGFDIAYDPFVGSTHNHAISYYQTYLNYFHYVMGYSVNLVPLSEAVKHIDDPEIKAMPIYPSLGAVKMINGVLVVRLSEDLRPEELRWDN